MADFGKEAGECSWLFPASEIALRHQVALKAPHST